MDDSRKSPKRSVIVLLGVARSGTSWLGGILDSHPNALYIHEPISKGSRPRLKGFVDDVVRNDGYISPQQRMEFIRELSLAYHENYRPPFFKKVFIRSPPWLIWTAWMLVRAVHCGKGFFRGLFSPSQDGEYDLVIKDGWTTHVHSLVRAVGAKPIILIRHPCAVVTSVLRGQQLGLMGYLDRSSYVEQNSQICESLGFDRQSVLGLEDCEFLALYWLVENLAYEEFLASHPGTQLIVYERLCQDPIGVTRAVFDSLDWQMTAQTVRFLEASTTHGNSWMRSVLQGKHPYFGVYRRSTRRRKGSNHGLSDRQAELVMSIVQSFPHMDYWLNDEQANYVGPGQNVA